MKETYIERYLEVNDNMLIVPKAVPSSHGIFKKTVNSIDGFRSRNRFIIFSEVKSNTIPDIIDLIFNLEPGGTTFLDSNTKKTKVMVINQSEVYGDAHGRKDTRTRNCYIHYGFTDCTVEQITGDTMITFTDMDWNVIADKPWGTNGRGPSISDMIGSDVNVSYDIESTGGGAIYRDTDTYNEILIPSPEFYDEKDMLLVGDRESNYNDDLNENKSFNYYNSFESYYKNLYRIPLNDLIDEGHTKIFKLAVTIDKISAMGNFGDKYNEEIDQLILELASELKYSMEICGFSGGEIDLGGEKDGFNFHNLKSYIRMEKDERFFHFNMFINRLDEIARANYDLPFVLMFNMRTDNVNVKVIDKRQLINSNVGSDNDPEDLSKRLKIDSSYNSVYSRNY